MLIIQGLGKSYRKVEAISAVSFEVRAGEIFGLLGSNGAGKSTTLECVAGIIDPDAGEIKFNGQDLTRASSSSRRRLGMAPQRLCLPDLITVEEAFGLFAAFHGLPSEIRKGELSRRFSLAEHGGTRVRELSGGQQQRLNVALAFVGRPKLVILDEPAAGLDEAARGELRTHLRHWREQGRSALLSTQDIAEAEALCDRVAVMQRGRVLAIGRPAELAQAASRAVSVKIETDRPLPRAELAGLGDMEDLAVDAYRLRFKTANVQRALENLLKIFAATGTKVVRMELGPLTLEEAVVRLTADSA